MNKSVDIICYGSLTTFESRMEAFNFYKRCSLNSEGAERDRYFNIIVGLVSSENNMIHDGEGDMFRNITEFKDGHCGNVIKDMGEWVKYSDYIKDKTLEQSNSYYPSWLRRNNKKDTKNNYIKWLRSCGATLDNARQRADAEYDELPPRTTCKYCGKSNNGMGEDVLCQDCRETFGHTLYSQL